ncbi:ComEA family DNA-binding protein [Blastococcus sp. SYSU D00695]
MRLSSRLPARRGDDADVIRARLRVLLDEGNRTGGWLPDDLTDPTDDLPAPAPARVPVDGPRPAEPEDRDQPEASLPPRMGRHRAPGPAVRVAPTRGNVRALLVTAVAGAVLLVGWTWLDRPRAEPVEDRPAAAVPSAPAAASPSVGPAADTAPTVTVSVVGRVARPGLVVLPEGSRVADAVAAAGGLLPDTDPATVNLAAVVSDGQQIAVGVPGAPAPGAAPGAAPAPAASGGRTSLNTATAAELDALPGIGPVLAQRIVDHRARNGPFTAIEQLEDVPGIGPATYDELVDLVTV